MTSYYPVSNEIQWHETLLSDLLGALSARPAAALLVSPRVHLRKGAHAINPRNDDPTSVTEAAFTGYAVQTPTIVGPVSLSANGKGVQFTVVFTCSAHLTSPEDVTGWYLTDEVAAAPTRIYAEGGFDGPLNIANTGDSITLTVVLPLRAVQER